MALFQNTEQFFKSYPSETLVRNMWHWHDPKHLDVWIHNAPFEERSLRYLGIEGTIYSDKKQVNRYSHQWMPLPANKNITAKYLKIFDEFNCYGDLNYYTLNYGIIWSKLTRKKSWIKLFEKFGDRMTQEEMRYHYDDLKDLENNLPKVFHTDLAFDFDTGDAKEIKNIQDIIPYVSKLSEWLEKHQAAHQIFFSGKKGFHLVVPYQVFDQPMSENNDQINKQIVEFIQAETGDLHIDPAIYSKRRQFRLPNSIHTSGLWKIALTQEDLERGEHYILNCALNKKPLIDLDITYSPKLADFRFHAEKNEQLKPKYSVRKKHIKTLKSFKESDFKKDQLVSTTDIKKLSHPPCIKHALEDGVVKPIANRNIVTVFLATYFYQVSRNADETIALLTDHALRVLKKFSSSNSTEIIQSTKTAIQAVFTKSYKFNCAYARKLGYNCSSECEIYKKYRPRTHYTKILNFPTIAPQKNNDNIIKLDSLDSLRKNMIDIIDSYTKNLILANRKRNIKPLIVKAQAGSGKTTSTYHWIYKKKHRTIWVGSRLALYDNIPLKQRKNWLKIRGRVGEEKDDKTGEILPATCVKHKLASQMRKRRLDTYFHLCEHCDYNKNKKNPCLFFRQFQDLENNWFVQQPTFLYKAKKNLKDFDVLVFDEDILQQFIENVEISSKEILQVMKLIREKLKELFVFCRDVPVGAVKRWYLLYLLLDAVKLLLEDKYLPMPLTGRLFNEHLQLKYKECISKKWQDNAFYNEFKFYNYLIPETIWQLPAKIDSDGRDFVNKIYLGIEEEIDKLPLGFTKELITIMDEEYSNRPGHSPISRLNVVRKNNENILLLNHKIDPPAKSKPTIILDATARRSIYEILFDHRVDMHRPLLPIKNEVWQCYSTNGSIQSFHNPKHKKRMFKALKKLLKDEPDSLIICKEEIEKEIRATFNLHPKTQLTHFYANRGSNEFQSAKHVIIFGSPGFPDSVVKQYAAALYPEDQFIADIHYVTRRYEGTYHGVKVMEYMDSKLQSILEISREDEIYQGLSRIRLILDKAKRVTLLTNIPIPGILVTKLFSLNELINDDSNLKFQLKNRIKKLIETKNYCIPSWDIYPHFDTVHRTTLDRNIAKIISELGLKKQKITIKKDNNNHKITVITNEKFKKHYFEIKLKHGEILYVHDEK